MWEAEPALQVRGTTEGPAFYGAYVECEGTFRTGLRDAWNVPVKARAMSGTFRVTRVFAADEADRLIEEIEPRERGPHRRKPDYKTERRYALVLEGRGTGVGAPFLIAAAEALANRRTSPDPKVAAKEAMRALHQTLRPRMAAALCEELQKLPPNSVTQGLVEELIGLGPFVADGSSADARLLESVATLENLVNDAESEADSADESDALYGRLIRIMAATAKSIEHARAAAARESTERDEARQKATEAEGKRDEAKEELRIAREQANTAQGERDGARNDLRTAQDSATAAEERATKAEGERDQVREDLRVALERATTAEGRATKAEGEREDAKEELRIAQEQAITAQGERDAARNDLRTAQGSATAAEERATEAKVERDAAVSVAETAVRERDEARQRATDADSAAAEASSRATRRLWISVAIVAVTVALAVAALLRSPGSQSVGLAEGGRSQATITAGLEDAQPAANADGGQATNDPLVTPQRLKFAIQESLRGDRGFDDLNPDDVKRIAESFVDYRDEPGSTGGLIRGQQTNSATRVVLWYPAGISGPAGDVSFKAQLVEWPGIAAPVGVRLRSRTFKAGSPTAEQDMTCYEYRATWEESAQKPTPDDDSLGSKSAGSTYEFSFDTDVSRLLCVTWYRRTKPAGPAGPWFLGSPAALTPNKSVGSTRGGLEVWIPSGVIASAVHPLRAIPTFPGVLRIPERTEVRPPRFADRPENEEFSKALGFDLATVLKSVKYGHQDDLAPSVGWRRLTCPDRPGIGAFDWACPMAHGDEWWFAERRRSQP